MTGLGKHDMTEMTGIVPVTGYATRSEATEEVTRTVSNHFSNTECRYYLTTKEARRPDRPIFDQDSWEVPVHLWVSHPDLRYGDLWEFCEAVLTAHSLTVSKWGADHTPGE